MYAQSCYVCSCTCSSLQPGHALCPHIHLNLDTLHSDHNMYKLCIIQYITIILNLYYDISDFNVSRCRECFDAVYGSSAGAINATYFLSGQREGVRIYYEDIANKQFVDLSRLLDRKNEQGSPSSNAVWPLYAPHKYHSTYPMHSVAKEEFSGPELMRFCTKACMLDTFCIGFNAMLCYAMLSSPCPDLHFL